MFDIQVKPTPRSSTCIEAITVNPIAGTATVRFVSNGYEYKYSNVSRAKILNLLLNDNISLGFWIQELVNNSTTVNYTDRSRQAVLATGKPVYELVGCSYSSTAALPF